MAYSVYCCNLRLSHYWNLINCLFQMFISLPLFHIMVPFTFDFSIRIKPNENLTNTTLFPTQSLSWNKNKKIHLYKMRNKKKKETNRKKRKETKRTLDISFYVIFCVSVLRSVCPYTFHPHAHTHHTRCMLLLSCRCVLVYIYF